MTGTKQTLAPDLNVSPPKLFLRSTLMLYLFVFLLVLTDWSTKTFFEPSNLEVLNVLPYHNTPYS